MTTATDTPTFTWSRPKEIVRRRIQLSLIDVPSEYERKDSLVEDDALRKSIEKSGVQQPIIVLPVGERFTLVKGGRRLAVALFCNLKEIPVIVDTPPDDVEIETYRNRLRFVLTHARQDLSPSQRCTLIKQMMESFNLDQKDIALYLGVDPGSVSNWLAIGKYAPEIVEAIDRNEITSFHARSFDGMKPEGQTKVFRKYRKNIPALSGHQFHRLVRSEFSPRTHSDLYVAPEKTIEKLARAKKGRTARSRPKLSKDEKKALAKDLEVRETELADSRAELKEMKVQIGLATQPVNAIMRNKELREMLPESVREEFERFVEIY